MFDEGFTLEQAIRVVVSGAVIEADARRNRWLFCGTVPGMRQETRFRGRWLHVSVERDDTADVAIVAMYRPNKVNEIVDEVRRKQQTEPETSQHDEPLRFELKAPDFLSDAA